VQALGNGQRTRSDRRKVNWASSVATHTSCMTTASDLPKHCAPARAPSACLANIGRICLRLSGPCTARPQLRERPTNDAVPASVPSAHVLSVSDLPTHCALARAPSACRINNSCMCLQGSSLPMHCAPAQPLGLHDRRFYLSCCAKLHLSAPLLCSPISASSAAVLLWMLLAF